MVMTKHLDESKNTSLAKMTDPYSSTSSAAQNTQARTAIPFNAAAVHNAPARPTLL